MGFKKYPIEKVDIAKIKTNAITTEKLRDGAVSTEHVANTKVAPTKIPNKAVTSEKIADGSLELHHFNPSVRSSLKEVDPLRWLPLLRYKTMVDPVNRHPTKVLTGLTGANLLASLLGITYKGYVGNNFRGVDYARLFSGGHGDMWSDKDCQTMAYGTSPSGVELRLSVFCVKNTSNMEKDMAISVYTSSTSDYPASYAEVVYKIVDLDEFDRPVPASLQRNDIKTLFQKTATSNADAYSPGSISVPAGKGLIFMLKTAGMYYTNTTYNFMAYHNHHGFLNMVSPSHGKIKNVQYPNNPFEVCIPMYEAILALNN